ncbi:MAG TPA: asparagine synthase (glutamine-hydrolyzing) [Blastocatellia bacterium]|nr:asparagine synthase (glutamine-hydrolyzing) [Blastocatellia bacterium]
MPDATKQAPRATFKATAILATVHRLTMCGICGIYEYGASEPTISESLVVRMRDRISHRGPDDAGVFISEDRRVGFGNRRLAVVDLSPAGHAPMPNEDGRVWITFNGEIYNHERLRNGLIEKGHRYRSRTDTESVIHLYEERGLDFVHDLEGDFAIALWDEGKQRLVLARDPLGVKPLYYTAANGRLIFASEIKAILEHPQVARDVDEEALYHYLTFLTTPAPMTLFRGIKKLPAGCLLTCDTRGEIKITRYWDAVVTEAVAAEIAKRDEQDLIDELRRLLSQSIEKRMMSDVPFGVFLSGGIDSTANVGLMARLMSRPVRTFTVGFSDSPAYNEIEEARDVARFYSTDHHEVIISQQELLDFLPDLIFHQDEPIADPVCVPIYYVSRLARQTGTKVIQVGEGSDELFCGYRDYVRYLKLNDYGWRWLAKLPAAARRAIAKAGQRAIDIGGAELPPAVRKIGPDLLRRLAAGEELFWSGAVVFDEAHKHELFTQSARQKIAAQQNGSGELSSYSIARGDLERLLAANPKADVLERMIYQELKLRLAELLLMRVDKMTMAASVEARVPFLDHKLVEFAVSLPRRMKYRNGETKYILKRAMSGIVPERVINRKKKGFGAPINEWMLDRLGNFVEHSLFESSLRRRELFDYDFIKRLLAEHRSGRINYSFYLWSLLNLSLWYDQWIEGQGSGAGHQGSGLIEAQDIQEASAIKFRGAV